MKTRREAEKVIRKALGKEAMQSSSADGRVIDTLASQLARAIAKALEKKGLLRDDDA
jgi:hypothetical protein